MLRHAFATMSILLAACATTTTDATVAEPGWRKGTVLTVGVADSLGPPIDGDCREQAGPEGDPNRRYVEVQYFVGRHAHLRIVPIDDALHVVAGDTVYFRSFGCVDARAVGRGS